MKIESSDFNQEHSMSHYVFGKQVPMPFDTAVQRLGWDPARLPRPQ